jgi:hypothetical protein
LNTGVDSLPEFEKSNTGLKIPVYSNGERGDDSKIHVTTSIPFGFQSYHQQYRMQEMQEPQPLFNAPQTAKITKKRS